MSIEIKNDEVPILGEDIEWSCVARWKDGTAVDLSGATIYLTIKDNLHDSDENAAVCIDSDVNTGNFSITNAQGGTYKVYLFTEDQTELVDGINYWVEIKIKLSTGAVKVHGRSMFAFTQSVRKDGV